VVEEKAEGEEGGGAFVAPPLAGILAGELGEEWRRWRRQSVVLATERRPYIPTRSLPVASNSGSVYMHIYIYALQEKSTCLLICKNSPPGFCTLKSNTLDIRQIQPLYVQLLALLILSHVRVTQ
jgi:hypothetical protein